MIRRTLPGRGDGDPDLDPNEFFTEEPVDA